MSAATHRPEIERALRFVADHLADPLSVADVAKIAGLSEFHFHRVFHAAVGEPIGRFITRRRLEISALRLAYEPDRSITDVALSSGYSSAQNFTKAFTAHFGCSPSIVREPGPDLPAAIGKLKTTYQKDFRPADLYALPRTKDRTLVREIAAHWNRRVRFVDAGPRSFACLASTGGYALAHLTTLWTDLVTRALQLGLSQDDVDAWGVAFDSPRITAPELCRYHACVPCPPDAVLGAPLFRGEMPAGRWAVFRYTGDVSGVEEAYRSLYSCWFSESSVAPEDFVPYDHYVGDAPVDGKVDMEMWLRVRPRKTAR